MNKQQLVDHVADAAGLSKKDAAAALDAITSGITASIAKGDKVALPGFGSFERRERKARVGRNPQTGAAIKVAAAKVPAFKAGQGFKDAVNGTKKAAAKKPATKKK